MEEEKESHELKVGEKVRELREKSGLSLQEMADRSGYSSALLSQIENHMVSPPLGALIKMAKGSGSQSRSFLRGGSPGTFYNWAQG